MSTSAPAGVPLGSRVLNVTGLRSTGRRERYSARLMFFRVALGLPMLRVPLRLPVMLGLAVALSLSGCLDGRQGRLSARGATARKGTAALAGRARSEPSGL